MCGILPCTGQESVDLFKEKWLTAQQYVQAEKIDSLPVLVATMRKISEKGQATQQAKIDYLLGEYWHYQEQWQKGIGHFNQAIVGLSKDTLHPLLLAEAYLVKGYCLHELEELDETLSSYRQSLFLKQKILGINHLKVSNLHFNIGYILQEKRDLLASDSAFLQGLAVLQAIYTKPNEDFADFYEELGYNQSIKGDFTAAADYLQKALTIKREKFGADSPELIYAYKYLGMAYKEDEYYGKAIDYFRRALTILEQQSERNAFEESMLNFHIGKSYLQLKQYQQADLWFNRALQVDANNKFLPPEIHRLKGIISSAKGIPILAQEHFSEAIHGFKKNFKNSEEYLLATYESLVQHLLSIGAHEEALFYIDEGISVGQYVHKDQPNRLFDLYKNKGIYFQINQQKKTAENYFKKAQNTIGSIPNWEEASLIQLKNQIDLNDAYVNLYLQSNYQLTPLEDLKLADSILSTTVDLITFLTKNYGEQSTKQAFIDQFYQIFKQAVDVKYALFLMTKDVVYAEAAFLFSEKSKDLILLETLQNVTAFESAGVPAALIKEENQLKANITYLENKKFEERQRVQIDHQLIKKIDNDLFVLKEKYGILAAQIAQQYPKYHQLKFATKNIDVATIQEELLAEDQSIIEYFLSDSLIYAFLIQPQHFQIVAVSKPTNFEQQVEQFRAVLYSYRPTAVADVNNDSLINSAHQLGFSLYQHLFAPLRPQLTPKVTIVADGILGHLPFDALLTELPRTTSTKSFPHYLMFQHMFSFAHSINWLSELEHSQNYQFEQNFVGIAPLFKSEGTHQAIADFRLGLGPLKYNQLEVEKIQSNLGGQIIRGVDATRKMFLDHLDKGQILHLATHGKSNDNQGDYSYLAFAEPKQPTDHQFLYVKDLFNLKIPADLVVLSACETGLGEVKKGEGIVGIGKGFSYAGAKSLVTTLWRVSDNSTANFMPIFYKNLKEGLAKDEALWQAKKTFIQQYRSAAHPFFWSGYVAYGNMDTVNFQHRHFQFNWWLLLLGVGLVIFFLTVFYKKT